MLFALGGTLILGSFFLRLKTAYLLILTAALFVGTELLIPSRWGDMPFTNPIDLLNPLFLYPGGMSEIGLWSNYPILPWLKLVIFGIAFGHWLVDDTPQAYRRALLLGGVFLSAFVVLRILNGFGNIRPRTGNTGIDFFNVVKYPPSMTFTLLTMGVNLILLSAFARAGEKLQSVLNALAVFGRAPLFFYTLHLFLYAGLGWLFTPRGTSLPAMFPFWLLGLLILYPLCLWFGRLKQRQPATSILRFF
ncbi:MAG TPA: heparan-alpha-glucosaminide N-acetyltransferase domain-containing protein [Anaerolineae bacterium]|nr:heparan-alpha-glucosaminide N-acetyltransferase domain-containing protein [Anaerolineae bacterium]